MTVAHASTSEGVDLRNHPTNQDQEQEVTRLLNDFMAGKAKTLDTIIPETFAYLRQQACRIMRGERANHTWGPSGLLDEVMLRFLKEDKVWSSRQEFFAAAVGTMKRLLIDYSRYKNADKRKAVEVSQDGEEGIVLPDKAFADPETAYAVSQALEQLKLRDPAAEQIVVMRVLMDLTFVEIANGMKCSERKVRGDFKIAKAFLKRQLAKA